MNAVIKTQDVNAIDFNDIERTYRGDVGCACGCGGDYQEASNPEHFAEMMKHFKYITSGIKNDKGVEFFGNGIELSNPSYTKVTRLYFKKGISYNQYGFNQLQRTIKADVICDNCKNNEALKAFQITGMDDETRDFCSRACLVEYCNPTY